MLRTVRFLPDIVRLQQLLTRRFNNSIDGAEAVTLSAQELISKLPDGVLNRCIHRLICHTCVYSIFEKECVLD